MRALALVLLALAGGGCAAGAGRLGILPASAPAIEDRVWLETGPDAAPGALRAFLSDGTLILVSCGASYRLAAWRRIDATRLVWEEDGASIQAEIAAAGPREMALLVGGDDAGTLVAFRRAEAPVDCPAG